MKFTRVIVAALIATAFGTLSVQAQSRQAAAAAAPAEFPPASYQGKQYVDSKGCIFIRAGIDGNVSWVPRVTRSRQQVCGYQPTFAPGAVTAAAAPVATPTPKAPEVIEITVPASAQPTPRAAPMPKPLPAAVAQPAAAAPAPRTVAAARPVVPVVAPVVVEATARRPSPGPAPTVVSARRQAQPAPLAPRAGVQQGGGCANASPLSQQYINRGPGVRCGPQQEVPAVFAIPGGQASLQGYAPGARAVPRHVYDQRRNTQNVSIPKGYRPVWSDDRLNPHRAEYALRPAAPLPVAAVPAGYLPVERDDDRLNPHRGGGTAAGDAQSDQIWTRTVPRKLIQQPTDRPVVVVSSDVARSPAETDRTPVLRFSTRSAPEGAVPPASGRPSR